MQHLSLFSTQNSTAIVHRDKTWNAPDERCDCKSTSVTRFAVARVQAITLTVQHSFTLLTIVSIIRVKVDVSLSYQHRCCSAACNSFVYVVLVEQSHQRAVVQQYIAIFPSV
jgi:hypothetical protein